MPNTPNEVNRLKLGIITGGEEVWSNAQMEPTGEWFINKDDWLSNSNTASFVSFFVVDSIRVPLTV